MIGGRATGVISLQDVDREHAFSESDEQLLETLAGSLSVALENARLVHETRQRNAELALINSVQEAIAGELDSQAIYDAVGDRIRDVFDAQVVSIATSRRGDRAHALPVPDRAGRAAAGRAEAAGRLREARAGDARAAADHENLDAESERYGSSIVAGERPKSVLFVPLVAGGKATGVISLQNIDREHAFDEDDQRLLTTLAGSLSVALENARLVEETRQRVAELATVNSVGQALSSQLDLDALIELVGEQRARDVRRRHRLRRAARRGRRTDRVRLLLRERRAPAGAADGVRRGAHVPDPPGRASRSCSTGRSSTRDSTIVGTPSLSYLGVPILVGDTAIGVISVQSIDEEGRFGEADSRLLATIAANVGVAIQNARLFSEVERQREYFESLVDDQPGGGRRDGRRGARDRLEPGRGRALRLLGGGGDRPRRSTSSSSATSDRGEGREITQRGARRGPRAADHAAAGARTDPWSTSS